MYQISVFMNSFGKLFRMSIFGESHGPAVGITIDGCPSGISLSVDDFLPDLNRRKAGKKGTTPRIEEDVPQILSGVFEEKTTGSPISLIFQNNNTRSSDYKQVMNTPRPGHSDFVAHHKYKGYHDYRGGGHFSGRLTLGIVAAGVIAKKLLPSLMFSAQLIEAGGKHDIQKAVDEALKAGDSIGGLIECRVQNMPIGLGEPFFDKLESLLAHIIFAIPATKALEFGSGLEAAKKKGSEHNDVIINAKGETKTNNSGGINGGISNGNDLVFRVAIKPTSSIQKPQKSFNFQTKNMQELLVKGRHDACIALRAPVIIEAATALVLADLFMRNRGIHSQNLGS